MAAGAPPRCGGAAEAGGAKSEQKKQSAVTAAPFTACRDMAVTPKKSRQISNATCAILFLRG